MARPNALKNDPERDAKDERKRLRQLFASLYGIDIQGIGLTEWGYLKLFGPDEQIPPEHMEGSVRVFVVPSEEDDVIDTENYWRSLNPNPKAKINQEFRFAHHQRKAVLEELSKAGVRIVEMIKESIPKYLYGFNEKIPQEIKFGQVILKPIKGITQAAIERGENLTMAKRAAAAR